MKNKAQAGLFSVDSRLIGVQQVAEVLKEVGAGLGDDIYVHAELGHFGKIGAAVSRSQFAGGFYEALQISVGKRGTIIMPAFSYSFTRGEVFDLATTPSRVGLLTEYMRRRPGVVRSREGIFSVVAEGRLAKFYTKVSRECFGVGSVYDKLHEENGKIVFLGETFDMTFLHFVEQRVRVPYRFMKRFHGVIRDQNGDEQVWHDYFVRPLDGSVQYDLEAISEYFEKVGVLRTARVGASRVRAVSARDAFEALAEAIGRDERFLIKQHATANKN